MNTVLIVGLGAQARYAAEIFRLGGQKGVGMVSLPGQDVPESFEDMPILGPFTELDRILAEWNRPGLLLCCSSNALKEAAEAAMASMDVEFVRAVHPKAVVATTAELGQGVILNPCAVVQPSARVGSHVMLHAGAIVEHDAVVGDFCNIAPNATVAGHARVDRGAYVYSGAVVLPQVSVGAHAVVGAGAVVTEDVPEHATVVGAPARVVKVGHPEAVKL